MLGSLTVSKSLCAALTMFREARWLAPLVFGLLIPSDWSFTRFEYGVTDRVVRSLFCGESCRRGRDLLSRRLFFALGSLRLSADWAFSLPGEHRQRLCRPCL
jgi:hypothetical protein